MKIKNVLIVGGGSSGWMTAAAFVKQNPELNVTVVESKKVGIIGDATTQSRKSFCMILLVIG